MSSHILFCNNNTVINKTDMYLTSCVLSISVPTMHFGAFLGLVDKFKVSHHHSYVIALIINMYNFRPYFRHSYDIAMS